MIKWLALLLMAANAGLWAWTQGWLAPTLRPPGERQREPQRLQQQVRAESVTVLSPRAASAALEKINAAAASEAASEPGAGSPAGPITGAGEGAAPAASAPPRGQAARPAPR